MPRESFPAGIRDVIAQHISIATAAATVSADFGAAGLLTIAGGAGGVVIGQKCEVSALRFRVGDADFAGAGGTQTFELRRDSATGTALASITVALAAALRGAVIDGTVNAIQGVKLRDGDKLFLVRLAGGTVFTTGAGVFEVEAWIRPQARR